MKTNQTILLVLAVMCLSVPALAGSGGDNAGGVLPVVDDLVGLTPVTENSCLAIWIPMSEDQALAGLKWFNNDDQVVFPEILLESGTADYPVSLADCQVVAENVSGEAEQWSQVDFNDPVRCASSGLYVLFKFPAGSEYQAVGSGGGAALGFCSNGGLIGWMSSEGEDWFQVDENFGFAAQPIFVASEDWMLQMNGVHGDEDQVAVPTVSLVTGLGAPLPNPFNPSTEIKFTLARPSAVSIKVFDLQGRLVIDLVDGSFAEGEHTVAWHGRQSDGRRVGSGVYFARMSAGGAEFVRKLVLVK